MNIITEQQNDIKIEYNDNKMPTKLSGIFMTANKEVANGRIYSKKIIESQLQEVLPIIKNKSFFGELGHSTSNNLDMKNTALIVDKLYWDNNNLIGEASLLDTPSGNIAKELLKKGNIGISSKGLGTVDEETKYVNDDYKLLQFDLVGMPSNSDSWVNGIYEGVINEELNASTLIKQIANSMNDNNTKLGALILAVGSQLLNDQSIYALAQKLAKKEKSNKNEELEIENQKLEAKLDLYEKCKGLTDHQRNSVTNLLENEIDKNIIDKKFDIILETLNLNENDENDYGKGFIEKDNEIELNINNIENDIMKFWQNINN